MLNYKILCDWEQMRGTQSPKEGRRKSVEGSDTKYSKMVQAEAAAQEHGGWENGVFNDWHLPVWNENPDVNVVTHSQICCKSVMDGKWKMAGAPRTPGAWDGERGSPLSPAFLQMNMGLLRFLPLPHSKWKCPRRIVVSTQTVLFVCAPVFKYIDRRF